MITRTFKLCLNAGNGSAPYINVNQYDEGETWLFELYSENGERYIPSSGAIVGVKSDGHGIVNTGTVDSEGRVVITETQQMTASAGRAIYELSIDGLTHGTANFIVAVERKPTDDAVMSDSDLSLIQEAIDSAEVIVEVIGDGDPSEVIGEHVDAWLDNHPEATTTVEDGAITAPKINQSLWDKLLVSEEASGAVASFDDGADDVPVSSLKVALEPVQLGSGDPSPSNVRPIYPANSGNLFDPNSSGTEWVTSQNAVTTIDVSKSVRVPVVQGQALTLSNDTASSVTNILLIAFLNSSNTVLSRTVKTNGDKYVTATAPANAVTAIASFYQWAQVSNAQLELNSSASAYQPYQGIMVDVFGGNLIDLAGKWSENASHYGYTEMLPAGTYYAYVFTEGNEAAYNSIAQYSLNGTTYTDILTTDNGYAVCDATMQYNRKKSRITLHQSSYIRIGLQGVNHVDKQIYVLLTPNGSEYDSMPNVPPYAYASTMWMPYVTPTSYPYTLGREVYGGTVDLATGVLTVTKKFVTSSNFVKETSYDVGNSSLFSVTGINDANINPTLNRGSISDKLKYDTAILNVERTGFYVGYGHIYARIAGISTLSDFNTAIGGSLSVAYTLATPQTIQLTPTEVKTLLGYNNISSSGTVEVIYHADTKLYVDKMTAVDNNIIAPTEATFTATRNYTTNDLVIVNDTLYKCTANIASGSAITPNSNVQQTTLGALIKALS